MKRHDEGYVLAYVTVVLIVFCLVATTILTGALRNLQNQQNTNEQMKAQYAAEGEIEKVVSKLAPETVFVVGEPVCGMQVACKEITPSDDGNYVVTLLTQIPNNSVRITCEIVLDGTCTIEKDDEGKITSCTITTLKDYGYQSYQIGGVSE